MKCEQCEENLLSYLDQQLPSEEAEEIAGHVRQCSHCQKELEELKQFSRSMHNVTIPFRESIENVQAEVLNAIGQRKEEHTVQWVRRFFVSGKRAPMLWSGIASVCIIVAAFLLLRPDNSRLDQVIAWGIEHYPLVNQVHALRGDADGVRNWFREHHNVDVRPPEKVNYADLVGCKMTELESEPAPLLRFDGQQTSAVFILPARFSGSAGRDGINDLSRNGFHVELWSEEGNTYLLVSKSL